MRLRWFGACDPCSLGAEADDPAALCCALAREQRLEGPDEYGRRGTESEVVEGDDHLKGCVWCLAECMTEQTGADASIAGVV